MAKAKTTSWSDDEKRAESNGAHINRMEEEVKKEKAGEDTPSGMKIILPPLQIQTLSFRLVGDSSLICNRWSEKAKKQIRDKQMGKASAGKENKDPEADYQASLYHLPGGGYGFPSIAFKNAAVEACTSLGKGVVTKVAARQAFHVVGELIRIEGTPQMREDMVRVGMGTADIRYRGEFPEWAVKIVVRYNARVLSAEQVINLFNTAGFAVGVGEWRSEKDGSHGLYHVEVA